MKKFNTEYLVSFVKRASENLTIITGALAAAFFDLTVGGVALWLLFPNATALAGAWMDKLLPASISVATSAVTIVLWRRVRAEFARGGWAGVYETTLGVETAIAVLLSVFDLLVDGSVVAVVMGYSAAPGYGEWGFMYNVVTGIVLILSAAGEPLMTVFLSAAAALPYPTAPSSRKIARPKPSKRRPNVQKRPNHGHLDSAWTGDGRQGTGDGRGWGGPRPVTPAIRQVIEWLGANGYTHDNHPSVRRIAQRAGVSRGTAANALKIWKGMR